MTDEELTKVHVDLPHHWATGGESMWARALGDDRYRLENVPFFAYDLNLHDVVEARSAAPDQKPSVLRVVERSGHRTIRVIFQKGVSEADRLSHLMALKPLNVTSEPCKERYFALDVPPEADVDEVLRRLDTHVEANVLGYETCEARVPGSFDDVPNRQTE